MTRDTLSHSNNDHIGQKELRYTQGVKVQDTRDGQLGMRGTRENLNIGN